MFLFDFEIVNEHFPFLEQSTVRLWNEVACGLE